MKFEWEQISCEDYQGCCYLECTSRAKVPGGWIVRNEYVNNKGELMPSAQLVFIADLEHDWELD